MDNVMCHLDNEVSTRKSLNMFGELMAFVSQMKTKIVGNALNDNN